MNPDSPIARLMAQATALTRGGRLAEATQAIQRALRLNGAEPPASAGSPGPASPPAPAQAEEAIVLDGLVREIETPDAAPEATPHAHPDAPTPPATPQPARFEEFPFATAQGLRQYKLFTPAGLPDTPAPLVVMLHGCQQNPDDFAAGTRMNELAQEQGFRVLYPAQAPRSNMQRCWNWFQPGDQKRGQGEPALLAGMTRHVMQAHGVDTGRVYIAGLSAGGAMAAIMAAEYPDLFAAVGVHSGLPQGSAHDVGSAFAAMKNGAGPSLSDAGRKRVPLIVFHGDHDATVHPANGAHLVGGLGTAKVVHGSVDGRRSFVRSTYRDSTDHVVAEHWLVQGAGHAWSGGSADGSYTDPQGPDATREMLRFFATQRRV